MAKKYEELKKILSDLIEGNEIIVTFNKPFYWKAINNKGDINTTFPLLDIWAPGEDWETKGWKKSTVIKAIYRFDNFRDELYVTPLRPFHIKDTGKLYLKPIQLEIRLENVVSIKKLTSGIHYVERSPGIYVAESWGHRIIIKEDPIKKNWSYKIERGVSCSWDLEASNKDIKTLKEAMGEVFMKIHGWLFEKKEKPTMRISVTSYCSG